MVAPSGFTMADSGFVGGDVDESTEVETDDTVVTGGTV